MINYICSERVNLFEPNVYINMLVKISGKPTADAMIRAVKAAFAANEATLSKMVLDIDGRASYEKMKESGCSVSVTRKAWRELIQENEKIPFRINQGELIRVFIIPSADELSLLIMAHHLVGDGKGLTYFLEDIMTSASNKELEYKPLQLITNYSFTGKSKLPSYLKLYADLYNKKWNKQKHIFNWDDYDRIHHTYWMAHSSNVLCKSFTQQETAEINRSAKAMNVSVNSYLTAAFLKADNRNKTIGIAVDARKDYNRSLSNQATGISVDYTYTAKKSYKENARIIHKKMQNKLSKPVMKYFILQFIPLFSPTLIDSVLLYAYGLYHNDTTRNLAKLLGYKDGKTRELGISNLTRLDIPYSYDSCCIQSVLFIPPVVSYAKHIIGVATINGNMMISYHFMDKQNAAQEQKFFEKAIQTIMYNHNHFLK